MANFGFLEYSFNPNNSNKEDIFTSLNRLGFVHRSQHHSQLTGFWVQNSTILSLRETPLVDQPGVSGLGLIVSREKIEQLMPEYDSSNNLFVKSDCCGLRILLATEEQIASLGDNGYRVVDRREYITPGLEFFSGILYDCSDPAVIEFYKSLGFKVTKVGKIYSTLLSNENRFSLLMNRHTNTGRVTTAVCDVTDVFYTTSCYTVLGVPLKQFDIDSSILNFGNKLNYRIVGYNCAAFGNADSYTIENYIPNALPNMDLIFRMRKQYLNITEQTLKFYATSDQPH
jgi:hypothetical protein